MSYKIFAYFLLLVGLNFINPLHSYVQRGPAYWFADREMDIPGVEFNDLLETGEDIWLAGAGLYRLKDGQWEQVLREGRYTALCRDPIGGKVWYAGARGVGRVSEGKEIPAPLDVDAGYIWDLAVEGRRLWYLGSTGYGWIDLETNSPGGHWEQAFIPRPILLGFAPGPTGGLLVSSSEGLTRISEKGEELVLPASRLGGNLVSWLARSGSSYLLGTVEGLYRWSGISMDTVEHLESNYTDFFDKGLSNGIKVGNQVAITDYPKGVVLLNIEDARVHGYIGQESGLQIGDAYKIIAGREESIYILGKRGTAISNLSSGHRFFPFTSLWGEDDYRGAIAEGDTALLMSENAMFRLSEDGFIRSPLKGNPYWISREPTGRIAIGDVNSYEYMENGEWIQEHLSEPLYEVMWGQRMGYAQGADGLYSLSPELELAVIYPSEEDLKMLGELEGSLLVKRQDGNIFRLQHTGNRWLERGFEGNLPGTIRHRAEGSDFLIVSTEDGLYRLEGNSVRQLPVDSGWQVRGLAARGESAWAILYNRNTLKIAIGRYDTGNSVILSVPHLPQVGDPIDLVVAGNRLGVIGRKGVGWLALDEMPGVTEPEVSFDLLFENKRVQNRTIPSGMHFIELRVEFSNPEIPVRVQYRINEQRWRDVNLADPSLQFAGHGNFTVELRGIHPNGVTSKAKVVQFGIAPPWYFNPIYQGVLLITAILIVWGIYILRHAQLKRMNLWLQAEVKKQTRELEAASTARTNFLAGLSHDIRNPLNGVLMTAETLSRNPPTSNDDPRLRDLKEFGLVVDRMLGEILDFSAIDQTAVSTSLEPVAIPDILRTAIQQNQFLVNRHMIQLTLSLPGGLEGVYIRTDRNWMIKILSNLIVNAVDYSESEKIEIGAKSYYTTDQQIDLELFVADWGKGIDESEKKYVFDRFYRGESGIESGKHGTGLGLSICQEIAHAMGAHLLLEDNEPSGCRFILKGRFPIVEGASEMDRESILATLSGKRILVVDDLAYNRRSIVEFLRSIGCQCDESDNGREALEMLKQQAYYLALVDWDLPGLMGPDVARKFREEKPDDPVLLIALTAYTEGDKKRLSEQVGMNGYISKPLTASRLALCLSGLSGAPSGFRKGQQSDKVDTSELVQEINSHIEECIRHGDHGEWENLRRCAHRLTTLALMQENKPMQQVCRDLQIAAQSENVESIFIGLAELRQWKKA